MSAEAALEEAIRALAHPGRRTMLELVWDVERPATELAEAAGLSPSAASQHLKVLREAGLVLSERRANWAYYHLHPDAEAWVRATLTGLRD